MGNMIKVSQCLKRFLAMKSVAVFLLFVGLALAAPKNKFVRLEAKQDDCLHCAEDIVAAVADCEAEGTPVLQCVEDALGAASDCLMCICDIIHIVDAGSGMCDRN